MLRSSGSVCHSHVRCLILNENFQFGLKVTFFKIKFMKFKYFDYLFVLFITVRESLNQYYTNEYH